jgi:phosphate transport system substrate-binding protein
LRGAAYVDFARPEADASILKTRSLRLGGRRRNDMLHVRLCAALLGVVCAAACGAQQEAGTASSPDLQVFEGLEGSLDIAGGTAHIPVMEEAAKRIMKAFPKIRITVGGGGSGIGIQKVGEGLIDIGNAGRPVKEKEQAKYQLTSFAFAIDGVAVVVHPSNPVREITTQQAQDAFAGKITNWKDLGGPDAEIHLYGRDEASGTRAVFWKKLLAKGDVAKSANIVKSNGAMKTAISRDVHGLGYMSIGRIDDSLVAVAIDGVAATQENATDGSYGVTRKLFMNTKGEPQPLAQAFIDYIASQEGGEIVAAQGYIPLATP